jgi:hypothetical protein
VSGGAAWSRNSRSKAAINGEQETTLSSRRNQFVSHNIRLSKSSSSKEAHSSSSIVTELQNANSLLEQVAIIAKHKLQHRFPVLKETTSVEIWCHQRPPDGCHQLHYDMDEIRLWETNQVGSEHKRQKLSERSDNVAANNTNAVSKEAPERHEQSKNCGIFCPMVSCVLTIHVPSNSDRCSSCLETAKGAPTLVSNQSVTEHHQTNANQQHAVENGVGWLCFAKPNRLLAFEGSLLHGVVPGIPDPGSRLHISGDDASIDSGYDTDNSTHDKYPKRVTLMLGFWGDGVRTHTAGNGSSESMSVAGPNMSFPTLSSCNPSHWAREFEPLDLGESEIGSKTSTQPLAAVQVKPLWRSIECNNDSFEEYVKGRVDDSLQFSGRFFLQSDSLSEIDDEVVQNKS